MRKTLNLIIASLLFMMLSIPANAGHGFDDIIILQDKESEGEVIHRNPTLIPIECFLVSDSIYELESNLLSYASAYPYNPYNVTYITVIDLLSSYESSMYVEF